MSSPSLPGSGAPPARWALAAVLAVTLSGCDMPLAADAGGDGAEQDAIRETLVAAYVELEPGECERLHTVGYLTQTEDPDPEAALAECDREAEPGRFAESLVIEDLSVDGEAAEATFFIRGGCADGMTLRVELVDRGGWKLSRLVDAEVDRPRLEATQREAAIEQGFTRRDANCIIRHQRRRISTREIERSIVHAGQDHYLDSDAPGEDALVACLGMGTVHNLIQALRESDPGDAPPEFVDCLADRFESAYRSGVRRRALITGRLTDKIALGCRYSYEAGALGGEESA